MKSETIFSLWQPSEWVWERNKMVKHTNNKRKHHSIHRNSSPKIFFRLRLRHETLFCYFFLFVCLFRCHSYYITASIVLVRLSFYSSIIIFVLCYCHSVLQIARMYMYSAIHCHCILFILLLLFTFPSFADYLLSSVWIPHYIWYSVHCLLLLFSFVIVSSEFFVCLFVWNISYFLSILFFILQFLWSASLFLVYIYNSLVCCYLMLLILHSDSDIFKCTVSWSNMFIFIG